MLVFNILEGKLIMKLVVVFQALLIVSKKIIVDVWIFLCSDFELFSEKLIPS